MNKEAQSAMTAPAASEQPVSLSGQEAAEAEYVPAAPIGPVSFERDRELRIQATASHYIGPLPPPEMLAEYDRVMPGLAQTIVRRFESQSEHRMRLESQTVKVDSWSQVGGTILGGAIGLSATLGGVWLAAHGRDLTGFGFFISAVAGLVSAFGIGKRMHDHDLEKKREGE